MDERGAVTDQLADVIRIAQLVRKSGVLIVERGEPGTAIEHGSITFIEGQITEAQCDQLRGPNALNWLQGWGRCRFTFLPLSSAPAPAPTRDPRMATTGPLFRMTGQTAPYRVRDAKEVLPLFSSMGLTRVHRQLFLLIDGQRTTSDLIRLSARGADEIYELLLDLERAGLIRGS